MKEQAQALTWRIALPAFDVRDFEPKLNVRAEGTSCRAAGAECTYLRAHAPEPPEGVARSQLKGSAWPDTPLAPLNSL